MSNDWRYEGYHCCIKCDKEIPTINLLYAHQITPVGVEPKNPSCYHCGHVSSNSMFQETYEKVRKVDTNGFPIKDENAL